MNNHNIIINTDSYKPSHWPQYPQGTTKVQSYIEPRTGELIMFFGLQMFIKEYLLKPFTKYDIDEAEEILGKHGVPFNKAGWTSMLNKHGGFLPLRIDALPEGTVHGSKVMQARLENTDDEFPWLTSYVETPTLRGIWYGSTVATISFLARRIIKRYLEETADNLDGFPFKLHDFGARGVSSFESAGIGGLAHLATGAMGTDTLTSILFARKYYHCDMPGFSIPAAEHSTITSWGKDREFEAYRNMLKVYGGEGKLLAVVSDSYDILNAVENGWGGELRQEVIDSKSIVVVRPDSGHPATVVLKVVQLLDMKFGSTVNSKGYKLLNNVRVIQGDGINLDSIKEILEVLKDNRFSADNVAFGMGGGLLQKLDRDTFAYAMKACAAEIDGKWIDVYKDPVTDKGKVSKRGRLETIFDEGRKDYLTVREGTPRAGYKDAMRTVFENGKLLVDEDLDTIRARALSFM